MTLPFAAALARLAAVALLAAGFSGVAAMPAAAQGVLALVNNRAITSLDVAQRIRIAAMIDRKRLSSKEALEELIDDQAKVIEANRIGYRINDDGVENDFIKLAKANGQSVREFEDTLRRAGLEPNSVRDRIRANIAWQALLRDRVKLGTQVTREEVATAAAAKRQNVGKIVEYTLVPVVFVVPPGASPASRVAAANTARSRFSGCDNGFDALRSLPDIYIRPMTVRMSTDLSPQARAVLDKTGVNQMTPPSPGEQGIETIAVCAKKDVTSSEAADTATVADEVAEKKVQSSSKTYLADLRKKVTIHYRR